MPQLAPGPWFYALIISWLVLICLAPKKILGHTVPNEFKSKHTKSPPTIWHWPW